MEIYYEGTDITGDVQVSRCIVRDTSGGRCDSLEIEFENAAGWYNWGPQEDDQILVTSDGYDSGIMFLNTVLPEDGRFRILATSLPCSTREKAYMSFAGKTIEDIVRTCAIDSGMDCRFYGIDKTAVIPYIQRNNESCAAFLHRLLYLEGACLKCINGVYTAIDILCAQELEPAQGIEINAQQSGALYRRNGQKYAQLTVETPYARATATDCSVADGHIGVTINNTPARDSVQAGRWARGLLLQKNRVCESLEIQSEFNPGFAPMLRIDIEGDTDATGEWIIDEVEHDFIQRTSIATMRRCIRSII